MFEQSPNSTIDLFSNFSGYVRNFFLSQKALPLPLNFTCKYVIGYGALLFLRFQPEYIAGNIIINSARGKFPAQNLTFAIYMPIEKVLWTDF